MTAFQKLSAFFLVLVASNGWTQGPLDSLQVVSDVVEFSCGREFSAVKHSNGTFVGFGRDLWQNAIDGVGDLTNLSVSTFSIGYWSGSAILEGGGVHVWGNGSGGAGSVPAGEVVSDIQSGYAHVVALRLDSTIVSWGWNEYGQASAPSQSNVVQISAGYNHNLALLSDGAAIGWGRNIYAEASPPDSLRFVKVEAGWGATSGGIDSTGHLHLWGYVPDMLTLPLHLEDSTFIDFAIGSSHIVALTSSGIPHCWGSNTSGQIEVPSGLHDIVDVDAGGNFTGALRSDGRYFDWGQYRGSPFLLIHGCTDEQACNFQESALYDDGSCVYPNDGQLTCANPLACNYSVNSSCSPYDLNGCQFADYATNCDGDCNSDIDGDLICDEFDWCSDVNACNYDRNPTESCQYPPEGYNCLGACLVDSDGDGICDEFDLCSDTSACNYGLYPTEGCEYWAGCDFFLVSAQNNGNVFKVGAMATSRYAYLPRNEPTAFVAITNLSEIIANGDTILIDTDGAFTLGVNSTQRVVFQSTAGEVLDSLEFRAFAPEVNNVEDNASCENAVHLVYNYENFATMDTIVVSGSIQSALDEIGEQGCVLIPPGTYYENLLWPEKHGISLIAQEGIGTVVIDGSFELESALIVPNHVRGARIAGVIFQNAIGSPTQWGYSSSDPYRGSGIWIKPHASGSMTNCVVRQCGGGETDGGGAPFSGGVFIDEGAAFSLINCSIVDNYGPGIRWRSFNRIGDVTNCLIKNNDGQGFISQSSFYCRSGQVRNTISTQNSQVITSQGADFNFGDTFNGGCYPNPGITGSTSSFFFTEAGVWGNSEGLSVAMEANGYEIHPNSIHSSAGCLDADRDGMAFPYDIDDQTANGLQLPIGASSSLQSPGPEHRSLVPDNYWIEFSSSGNPIWNFSWIQGPNELDYDRYLVHGDPGEGVMVSVAPPDWDYSYWDVDDVVFANVAACSVTCVDGGFQTTSLHSPQNIFGCIDSIACNFNDESLLDDGTCVYPQPYYDCDGYCMNDSDNDGICDEEEVAGCQDMDACNFEATATDPDDCSFPDEGYDCSGECLLDSDGDGVCDQFEILGCLNPDACNFNPGATEDVECQFADSGYNCNGECINDQDGDEVCDEFEILGCLDVVACNYLESATDAGVCSYPDDFYDCLGECLHDEDSDGICDEMEIPGCQDETACNYNVSATDSSECLYPDAGFDCIGNCIIDEDQDGVCDVNEILGCTDEFACNFNSIATENDASCFYSTVLFDCDGNCQNDINQNGICDEYEQGNSQYAQGYSDGYLAAILDCNQSSSCGPGTEWHESFGLCLPSEICEEDLNKDGVIGTADLLLMLTVFGDSCQ